MMLCERPVWLSDYSATVTLDHSVEWSPHSWRIVFRGSEWSDVIDRIAEWSYAPARANRRRWDNAISRRQLLELSSKSNDELDDLVELFLVAMIFGRPKNMGARGAIDDFRRTLERDGPARLIRLRQMLRQGELVHAYRP
jgi:hypothetical protein